MSLGEKLFNSQVFKKVFKMTHQEFNCDGSNSQLSQLWWLFHRLVADYFCKKQNENSECADLWRCMLITQNTLILYSYLMRLPRAPWTWGMGWNVSTDYLPNINLIMKWLNYPGRLILSIISHSLIIGQTAIYTHFYDSGQTRA